MTTLVRFGDDLAAYIDTITTELEILEEESDRSSLSAFSGLLDEVEAGLERLQQTIVAAEQAVYDGVQGLPVDQMATGSVPPWLTLIEDGRCSDNTVSSNFKRGFLLDTRAGLQAFIDRNDLRPPRAGWGTVAVCVRSKSLRVSRQVIAGKEYRNHYFIALELKIDFHPAPDLACNNGRPVSLFEDTVYQLAGRPKPVAGDDDWIRLFRSGMKKLADVRAEKPVLPVGCRYRDHAERFTADHARDVSNRIHDLVRAQFDATDDDVEIAEATLMSWLSTSFNYHALTGALTGDLRLPDLSRLAEDKPIWRVINSAMVRLSEVRGVLRSDEMRDVARYARGHILGEQR